MEKEKALKIFEAIKSDDVKSFASFIASNSDLSLCFGRFPLLSTCYLFGSYKILNKFEKHLFKIVNFSKTDEIAEIYLKFKNVSGKLIRLYQDEKIVFPIEMLSILGDNETIARNYKKLYKNAEIISNIQKIYNLKFNTEADISQIRFEAKRNKMSLKKKLFLLCTSIFMIFMLAFPIISMALIKTRSGFGLETSPILVKNEIEFETALLKQKQNIKLINDIVLTKEVSIENFDGKIDGNGKLLTISNFQSKSVFNNFGGEIFNLGLILEIQELKINKSFSVLSETLTGKISNCSASGKLSLDYDVTEESYASIFAVTNNGFIENCNANLEINVKNNSSSDAFFSTFAGINNREITSCQNLSGKILADTVDVAGIVSDNYGSLLNCSNAFEIFQETDREWNPNSAGIALNNNGQISGAINTGKISSISNNLTDSNSGNQEGFGVFVSGIVCINKNSISGSLNSGELLAKCKNGFIYAGGIVSISTISDDGKILGTIFSSSSTNKILVEKDENDGRPVLVGGIVGLNQGALNGCGYEGEFDFNLNFAVSLDDSQIFSGGIAGSVEMIFNMNGTPASVISNCYASLKNKKIDYFKGGLIGILIFPNLPYPPEIYLQFEFLNCHYVSSGDISCSGYYKFVDSDPVQITDRDGIKSYNSLEELKNNARGLNFNV